MEEKTLTKFQEACGEALQKNKSVLLVAPTGTGKTIAAVEPFAMQTDPTGGLLNTRLIYSLPMRALANSIKKEVAARLQFHQRDWPVIIHHGQQAESDTFREHAIITTIDQTLTAFAGAPLSFTTKSGHSAAGALCTSYAVFDEVHLLDPKAGLPLLFAMLRCRQDWGLRSCVMTATLPKSVIDYFEKYLDMTVIRASDEDAKYRDDRRKVTVQYATSVEPTTQARVEAVIEAYKEHGRVIVFCNTVKSALSIHSCLMTYGLEKELMLAHSRFAPEHRQERDEQVSKCFGEESKQRGILVTTQVAEVGLNISAPVVFSELAPADTLIQRAGRCARFFRAAIQKGTLIVWPLYDKEDEKKRKELCLPYDLDVVEETASALSKISDGEPLTWKREQEFVDCLEKFYQEFLHWQDASTTTKKAERLKQRKKNWDKPATPLTPVTALAAYERAFHAGDAAEVESLLRDSVSVQVGIVENFEAAANAYNNPADGRRRAYPQTISLRLSTFAKLLNDNEWQVREVCVKHKTSARDNSDDSKPMTLNVIRRPRPMQTYFLLAEEAGYTKEMGLPVEGKQKGETTPPRKLPSYEKGQRQQNGREQTFLEHASGAHKEAKRILDYYRPFIKAWAECTLPKDEMTSEEMAASLEQILELAVVLHDIGKLNAHWQIAVGRKPGTEPLARTLSGKTVDGKPAPHHAQYVFPLLNELLCKEMGKMRLFEHIALAAARHHVLTVDGAINTTDQRFVWDESDKQYVHKAVQESLKDEIPTMLTDELLNCLVKQQSAGEAPGPSSRDYFLYCVTNRLVKFADTCDAAGGRSLELYTGPAAQSLESEAD